MASSDEGVNMCEAIEWHQFFSDNHLHVFDVIHGALSTAVLYWPDDFLKKRDGIIKFLYAKNKKNEDHMSCPPPPSLSFQEAYEWYEFFSNNHLDVFDVLHAALSVAALYLPDDFLKKRDEIAQFVNAKKPFQYKNQKIASTSCDTESYDHHTTIISHPVAADHMPSPPPPPSSMSFQEPSPPTTLHRNDTSKHTRLEANTEETKPKSDTRKPKKEISTQKIGHKGRLNKKEKQNHQESLVGELLLKHSSKDHHHDVQVSGRISTLSATTANKGTQGRSAETLVLSSSSSSAGAEGTSGFKKVDSAATAKMKLQTIVDLHDEATLERKLEATKRKLFDGYKNAQAAKKRIRLIDATYIIPNQQRNNVPVAVGSR